MNNKRYKVPEGIPTDQYGHVTIEDGLTDPYGDLEFAVGSGDDFVCFDYSFFRHENKDYVALHATVNSETGHFIQDFDYAVIPMIEDRGSWLNPAVLHQAHDMVGAAITWCVENKVKMTRRGWNQDPYYFVRSLCLWGCIELNIVPASEQSHDLLKFDRRRGGKKLNRFVNMCADAKLLNV